MALANTIEYTLEGAWVTVLAAASDLTTLLGSTSRVRRAYDLTGSTSDLLPSVTVACVACVPQLAKANGWYVGTVRVMALTSMDVDLTGQTRSQICAAIRDVFEGAGLEAALAAAGTGMTVSANSIQQTTPTGYDDLPDDAKPVRRAWFDFDCRVTMST